MKQLDFITSQVTWVVAGVDEAGRGPLAGPVVAAAVILRRRDPIAGLADSKTLSAAVRNALAKEIRLRALAWAVAQADSGEIDRLNVLAASLLAMKRAVEALEVAPFQVLVDGSHCPRLGCQVQAVIGGDARIPEISAASILAKVHRDEAMIAFDREFPGYGFARHMGYATAAHLAALSRLGACPIHRRSFAPVQRVIREAAGAG
ncbi:MAG: ribonuclease HII [Gammaproteobacteria bacterium]|nr:ribonuclease HII [Gammaproteobacteria bacterium]